MKKTPKTYSMTKSILLSQLGWLGSALLLLTVFCLIALSCDDPDSIILPLSLCALYLSSTVGGIFAVRLSGDGILSGALSGLITAGIVFLLSALPLTDSPFSLPTSLLLLSLIVLFSSVGAVIGHKRTKTPAKQRAKMRRMRG